jgi:hypothetical protein
MNNWHQQTVMVMVLGVTVMVLDIDGDRVKE